MPPKDRTSEFHSTLNSIKSRSSLSPNPNAAKKDEAKQRLLDDPGSSRGSSPGPSGKSSKSEFGKMAGAIAKDIERTTLKLQKLAQREWRLFHPSSAGEDRARRLMEQWPSGRLYSMIARSKSRSSHTSFVKILLLSIPRLDPYSPTFVQISKKQRVEARASKWKSTIRTWL